MSWMQEIRDAQCKEEILVGMEPTGNYWFSLGVFLRDNGTKPVLPDSDYVLLSEEDVEKEIKQKVVSLG